LVLKPGEIASASKNIVVASIVPNQVLANPFVILGRGRAFESVVNWRVRDRDGVVLASGAAMTDAREPSLYGAFRVRAFFTTLPKKDTGFVEVFTYSPRDGSEQDLVSIPVRFASDVTLLKVFFPNALKDPEAKSCTKVYPVTRRVMKTQNVAEAAILELLKGPTAAEQIHGSVTALLPSVQLRSITMLNDTATVNLSKEYALGIGDVCSTDAMKSQVIETMKQFSNVKTVVLQVEGVESGQFITQ
jgi:hypothetical protein